MKPCSNIILAVFILLNLPGSQVAAVEKKDAATTSPKDSHYTPIGFFDIHVCNWPEQPLFFMPLFSTARYRDIRKIEVFLPNGRLLGKLDMNNYRTIAKTGKPEKRVFMSHINIPEHAADGWYVARIQRENGSTVTAKDYVQIKTLPQAKLLYPPDKDDSVPYPTELSWEPVPGARFYQVFVRDLWNNGKLVFSSELIPTPRLQLPEGILQPGGYYSWKVHSRDVNEDILLGDFNHGSMSRMATFSLSE